MNTTVSSRESNANLDLSSSYFSSKLNEIWADRGLGAAPIWGDISRRTAGTVLLTGAIKSGLKICDKPSGIPSSDLFVWSGAIPPNNKNSKKAPACGDYIVANPYSSKDILRAKAEIANTGLSFTNDNAVRYRRGWSADMIAGLPCGFMESDDLSIIEQLERIWDVSDLTGIRPSVIALSGDVRESSLLKAGSYSGDPLARIGKSVHQFYSYEWNTDYVTWLDNQKMLCLLMDGDTSIINMDRLMRTPGGLGRRAPKVDDGHFSLQTALLADSKAIYPIKGVHEALVNACKKEGFDEYRRIFAIFSTINSKKKVAKKLFEDGTIDQAARDEIFSIVEHVKSNRDVDSRELSRIEAIIGRSSSSGTVFISRSKNGGEVRSCEPGTVVTTTSGLKIAVGSSEIPADGLRCYDPWAEDPVSSSASARLYPWGVFSEAGGNRISYRLNPVTKPVGHAYGFSDISLAPALQDPITKKGWTPEIDHVKFPVIGNVDRLLDDCAVTDFNAKVDLEEKAIRNIKASRKRAGLLGNLASRIQEADSSKIDNVKLEGARQVESLSIEIQPRCKAHLESNGMPTRESVKQCGYWTGLIRTSEMSYSPWHRDCHGFDCPRCAPGLVSTKIAAIMRMPIEDGEGNAVAESSFIERNEIYRYDIPLDESALSRWVDAYRSLTRLRVYREEQTDLPVVIYTRNRVKESNSQNPEAYVAFRLEDRISILTTVKVGGIRVTKKTVPIADTFTGEDSIKSEILRLGLEAFRVEAVTGMDVEDILDLGTESPKKTFYYVDAKNISSSKNLKLNPDVVIRSSKDSRAVTLVDKAKSPKEAIEVCQALKLGISRIDIRDEVDEFSHRMISKPIETSNMMDAMAQYQEHGSEIPSLTDEEIMELHVDDDVTSVLNDYVDYTRRKLPVTKTDSELDYALNNLLGVSRPLEARTSSVDYRPSTLNYPVLTKPYTSLTGSVSFNDDSFLDCVM